ncbi:hypothetical protein M2266_001594 [Streptomyces sp. SPB162]|nr:hypothetical protein [Streptomyces sp. SPB162]
MSPTPPSHRPIRPLHLAFAIDGWEQHRERYEVAHYVELARLAESGALDFVTLDDAPAPADGSAGGLDALAVLTQAAPATDRIGLVAAVTAAHPGPVPAPAGIVLLDRISRGRAGWTPLVPDAGTADAPAPPRDGPVDVTGLHDVASAGAEPAEGWPVVAVDATLEAPRETAARHADVAYVRVGGPHSERLAYEAPHRPAPPGGRVRPGPGPAHGPGVARRRAVRSGRRRGPRRPVRRLAPRRHHRRFPRTARRSAAGSGPTGERDGARAPAAWAVPPLPTGDDPARTPRSRPAGAPCGEPAGEPTGQQCGGPFGRITPPMIRTDQFRPLPIPSPEGSRRPEDGAHDAARASRPAAAAMEG